MTPEQLAEEFLKVESEDLRVVEVRLRALPPFLNDPDYIDRKGGKLFIWNAQVIVDKALKAQELQLKVEKTLDDAPARRRTWTRKINFRA